MTPSAAPTPSAPGADAFGARGTDLAVFVVDLLDAS
jgi:hypothetical protein